MILARWPRTARSAFGLTLAALLLLAGLPGIPAAQPRDVEVGAAHVRNNAVSGSEVGALIQSVFDTLRGLGSDEAVTRVELTPAEPTRHSVTDDHIVCLKDAKKLKMLKRHLITDHGLTPKEYRAKWGLKPDYPMVAPSYSAQRQMLAKQIGLGRKPAPPPPGPKPRRRRKTAA